MLIFSSLLQQIQALNQRNTRTPRQALNTEIGRTEFLSKFKSRPNLMPQILQVYTVAMSKTYTFYILQKELKERSSTKDTRRQ